jgi:hypothetical protein
MPNAIDGMPDTSRGAMGMAANAVMGTELFNGHML